MIRQFRCRAVLLSYFFFTEYLLMSREITRFIAPRFTWLTYISALLLGVFLFFAQRGRPEEHHSGKHPTGEENPHLEMAKLLFLVYPLLLFTIFRPVAMYDLAAQAVKPSAERGRSANLVFSDLDVEKDGYVHFNLYALWFLADNEPSLLNKYKFKVTGRVSRISGKTLSLQRIVMTCCAADAQPIEIKLTAPDSSRVTRGEWLSASGKVELRDGLTMLPDFIEKSQRPKDFYISLYETLSLLKIVEKPAGGR